MKSVFAFRIVSGGFSGGGGGGGGGVGGGGGSGFDVKVMPEDLERVQALARPVTSHDF